MTIQQRLLFQAEKNKTVNVGRCGLQGCLFHRGWIAVILALLNVSCASLTPDRIAVLSSIAGQAAQVGASDWLKKHPEHRELFETIVAELTALAQAGITTATNQTRAMAQIAAVERLGFLPVATLTGPDGAVYIRREDLVVWDGRKAVEVTGSATVPVIAKIRSGLKLALAPMPPMPGKHGVVSAPVGIISEGTLTGRDDLRFLPSTNDLTKKSDAELDAEFEAIKKGLRMPAAPAR